MSINHPTVGPGWSMLGRLYFPSLSGVEFGCRSPIVISRDSLPAPPKGWFIDPPEDVFSI